MLEISESKNKELKEYIKKSLSKGKNYKEIIKNLTSVGWKKDTIKFVISTIDHDKFEKKRKKHHGKHHLAYLAEDIMKTDFFTLPKKSNIKQVIEKLKDNELDYVVVMDKQNPLGIITTKEILKNIDEKGKINTKLSCIDIMPTPFNFCDYTDTLLDVCEKMNINDSDIIFVKKRNKVVGIISAAILIEFMSYHG
jgi:CBS domain-containing protein